MLQSHAAWYVQLCRESGSVVEVFWKASAPVGFVLPTNRTGAAREAMQS